MNISIYIKLLIAYCFGKVKIKPDYKHIKYVDDNNYFDRIPDEEYFEINGFPLPSFSDYYSITTEGKAAFFNKSDSWHTRIISYIAIIISIISLIK